MNLLLELLLRATILLFAGLALWGLARNRSAESRVTLLRVTLIGLAILPAMWALGPRWSFVIPGVAKPEAIVLDLSADMLMYAQQSAAEPSRVELLPTVYLGIALLVLIPALIGHFIVRRMWANSKPLSWMLEDEMSEALDTVGVKPEVEGRLGPIASPMVFGGIRRRLLLPLNFAAWPEDHRRLALLHEAAHLKRFDCAWQHLAHGVRAVYWCHPLVWFLSRALKDETELAADERAIRSGAEAADYASALVAIARTLQEPGRLVRSQGVTFMNHRQLDRRVRSVLHGRRRGFTCAGSLAMMAFAAISTYIAAGANPQKPLAEIIVTQPVNTVQALPLTRTGNLATPTQTLQIAPTVRAKVNGKLIQPSTVKEVAIAPVAGTATKLQTRTRTIQGEPANVVGVRGTPAPAPIATRTEGVAIVAPASPQDPIAKTGKTWAPSPLTRAGQAAAPARVDAFRGTVAPSAASPAHRVFGTAVEAGPIQTRGTANLSFTAKAANGAWISQSPIEVQVQDKELKQLIELLEKRSKEDAEILRRYKEAQRADDRGTAAYRVKNEQLSRALNTTIGQSRTLRDRFEVDRKIYERAKSESLAPATRDAKLHLYEGTATPAQTKSNTLPKLTIGNNVARTVSDRVYVVSAGTSQKPVTINVSVDGKMHILKVVPDKDGLVKITIDEKGKIKASGG